MKRLVACLAVVAGCEVSSAQQRQAIVGGVIDTRDPGVVAIVGRRTRCEDNAVPILCSGTLIAPRVVLTAAHCLRPGADHGTLEVYVGSRVGDPAGRYIAVDEAARHPKFDDATHAYDLGLVWLAEDAPVAPVALPSVSLDPTTVGSAARVVGYGVTAVGMIADGNRREGAMTVSSVASLTFETAAAPGNSCGGDSGGPVLVAVGGGEQLLGVTVSGDATCTVRATNGRIDVALNDFIRPLLARTPLPAEGPISLDRVCTTTCETATDCPAAMTCLPDDKGVGRCQIASERPGNFTSACTTNLQCGSGTCARVRTDECRCYSACDQLPAAGSCSASGGASPSLALLIMIAFRRRRSARRTRAGSTREAL